MVIRPDMLVLGGGGVLGEAWMSGVLGGIEDSTGIAFSRCEYFVGTSAGSILCAQLAAGRPLERPAGLRNGTAAGLSEPATSGNRAGLAERTGAWALALSSPLVPVGLSLTGPGRALARAALLRLLARPQDGLDELAQRVADAGARFDGRLRIAAVARASGRRVVFGRPRSPEATVAEAVTASCAVPWLFRPVRVGGVEYVDGGVWSPTNLDAAPAGRGSLVLCLNPTAGLAGENRLISAARGLSRSLMTLEAAALRSRGALVTLVAPDAAGANAMGTDLMARDRRPSVLAAGYRQGWELGRQAAEDGRPRPRRELVSGR